MKQLVGFLLVILSVAVFIPTMSSAAEVWSDDFQDGDYVGWTVLTGTFSAEKQFLQGVESEGYQSIQHSSSVAYGNWSFDVYHNSSVASHFYRVYSFMADELIEGSVVYAGVMVPRNGYSIDFAALGADFNRWENGSPLTRGDFSITFSGWRTITIIRDRTGHFEFYLNETLVEEADDTTYTTSAVFGWCSMPGNAIDNIIVSEFEPSLLTIDPLLIGAGVGIAVIVIAIVVYFRRR
ncbi:MAG: hypothetical protein ACFFEK_00225 [Candidatus Thorarchaeota archaeon]